MVSAVSLSDSPLSTAEPDPLIDITSAESRLAASSKLEEVRVDDSKNMLTTVRPLSAGSFLASRSSEAEKVRASASSRSTSSLVRSAIEMRCLRPGRRGGRSSSRINGVTSAMVLVLAFWDEKDAVDFVHLDELHLDALAAGGGKVLSDVVGPDGKLAVAPVDEARQLDARRAPVFEDGLDRCADRPARVEDVVHEDAGHALEGEVELRRLDDGLSVDRPLAAAHDDVVAMEGDVDAPDCHLDPAEVRDQPPEPLGERNAPRLNADESDTREVAVALDDLVSDAGDGPVERLRVQEDTPCIDMRSHKQLLSGLSGPG